LATEDNAVELGKRSPHGGHITCPACGDPLQENGNMELQCEACGRRWQSLGIDYRQGTDVLRLKRVDGVSPDTHARH
jgi:tRNA(Ile2) C34 agmatinyltransferase TiaS